MDIAVDFFTALIRAIFEFLHFGYSMTEPPERDPVLKAEFDSSQKTFSIFNEGFCVDGKRSMSLKDSFRHAVIVGKSGIGKSTSTFIPSLLTMPISGSSFVVHDTAKELLPISGGYLRNEAYSVKILDFVNPDHSIGFNPLENIQNASDIDRLANMLVRTSLKQSDPFWNTSSEQLIKTVISLALNLPNEHRNLANVLHLIKLMDANPKRVDMLMSAHADQRCFVDYKAFLAKDSKVRSGIIATATAALSIFGDEKVALVTSKSTFHLKDLRRKKVALFIQNNVSSLQYLDVINSIFFEQLYGSLLESMPKPKDKSVYILLDEAASGLRMPSFSNAIAHFRKYRVGCLIGLQSIEQLRETYSDNDATTILANCFVQMYFSEQSHSTAKMLEDMLGKYNYTDEAGHPSLTRNLMEANEIRMMGKNKAIIIVGGEKPILADLVPFYDRWWLKLRANLKPPVMVGVGIGNEVSYIE